jgi:carbon-monoxide dehydrogenase small subunit
MILQVTVNCQTFVDDVKPDTILLDYLRSKGFASVKRGCNTTNCGLCTVLLDGKPVLSCAVLALRCDRSQIFTLEGLQPQAKQIGGFLAQEGAEQCGFCNPGMIMNMIALSKELTTPTESEILHYLQGNLCRCSGYMGQLRAIQKYLNQTKSSKKSMPKCEAPVKNNEVSSQ